MTTTSESGPRISAESVTVTSSGPPTTIVRNDGPRPSFFKKLFGFLGWVLTGFGLFGDIGGRSARLKSEEVVVYAVHQSFFLWALVLTGFVGATLTRHWPSHSVLWGWIYAWVLLYTLVTLLFDVNTIRFLLWVGVFSFAWLASKYLEDMNYVPVLTGFFAYFHGLRPQLDPGFATVISWILLPAWIGSLFATFSRGRKTFSPNSVEEWYLGEGCEITDRAGLKFRTRYRDLFETLLGLGAGDLEAIDGSGHVVKRWSNILFLAFTWKRLDEILHQRSAVVDNAKTSPVEVEDVRR